MARARNIKPKFFQNEELAEIPPLGRLLFIGLWTICDYRGCLEYRPKRIRAQLLPYDDCDIEGLLINLEKSGFIQSYTVKGQKYIKIVTFERHQTPHKNERDAGTEFPDITEKDNEISELKQFQTNPDKDGTTPASSLFPIPDSLTPQPSPEPAAPYVRAKPREPGSDREFIEAWDAYPKRPGASRADTFKAWTARVKEGVLPEVMLAGVRRYAAYVAQSRTEPQYIKQPSTFFGPGKHYDADWTFTDRRPDGRGPSRHNGFDQLDYKEGVDDDGRF
jgi:hypothetical protein